MALLVVITTLMVLTVIVTELAHGSTVRLQVGAHQRDRTQAYWISRTGINVYRLILTANRQMAGNSYL
ncbi:MAG: hypothetical protein QGG40_20980, partial [Myxococcota bacterium]|nr:hypothetical protein [Myxococcota bacterium]